MIDPEAIFQPELMPNERIVWTGQPDPSIVFSPSDIFLVPFSVFWGGFAIVWETLALGACLGAWGGSPKHLPGPVLLMPVFGAVFVCVGLYFMIGRFFYKKWRKMKTWYAVTDQRVLVVSVISHGKSRSVQSAHLKTLPNITKSVRSDGVGSIRFGHVPFRAAIYQNTGLDFVSAFAEMDAPAFYDIKDVENVYQLVTRSARADSPGSTR